MQPTYFVKAVDGQYSKADPQPIHRNRVLALEADLASADQWAADHSEFVNPVYAARLEWGLQWMLNNLTGIDHEWAKEACNIARQSLNPRPKG
jgi:hypothetical protein